MINFVKICGSCKVEKNSSEFNKHSKGKYGLQFWCRECCKTSNKLWDNENLDKKKEKNRVWYEKNTEKSITSSKIWKENNPDKVKVNQKTWENANPDKKNGAAAKRRAFKKHATLKLSENDNKKISEFYEESVRLTKETGIPYEVDHIVPLQSKKVCGLHVPWNLKVITEEENRKKGNKLIEVAND